MTATLIFAGILIVLLVLFVIRIVRGRPADSAPGRPIGDEPVELLMPTHIRYYPQVRQALSRADREYMERRASPALRRSWVRERRRAVRGFLTGLMDDFKRLEQLGRTVASLSPELSQELERERLWLGVRFRFWYAVLWAAPVSSQWTLRLLDRTTAVVGSIANKTTTAMNAVSEMNSRAEL